MTLPQGGVREGSGLAAAWWVPVRHYPWCCSAGCVTEVRSGPTW
jgi:hypothetical protein